MPGEVRLEGRDHRTLLLALTLGLPAHERELTPDGLELALQVLDDGILLDSQVRDLRQGAAVPLQVGLESLDHFGKPPPLTLDDVALGIEAQEFAEQVSGRRNRLALEHPVAQDRFGIRQWSSVESRDYRVPVDRRLVIVGVDQLVVETVQLARDSAQGSVPIHVHGEHHQRQPARQAGVADAHDPTAELVQLALHVPAHGKPVGVMLLEVAVLGLQLVVQELPQQPLSALNRTGPVGAGDDDPAPRHPGALPDEAGATPLRHVFEGVERHHRVHRAGAERQVRTITQHEPRLLGRLEVHDLHAIAREETAQKSRPTSNIEDGEAPPPHAQLVKNVRDEAVALKLVEGEVEEVLVHEGDSRSRASPPGSERLTDQTVGR